MHDTKTYVLERETEAEVGRLRVVSGPDEGQQLSFAEAGTTVGSGVGAGLRLSDPTVSRLHCELAFEPGGVRLRDLGSKNGCWLAGCRVWDVQLQPGSRVRIGSTMVEIGTGRETRRQAYWTGGDRFGPIVGSSPPMHRLFARLAQLAPTDLGLLVRGESGTGKEVVARAIHEASTRAGGPFVVVDGGALSRHLAESELFGHARGAFTGAHEERAGAFERADGGTLFLDEIGELPTDVQPKLLRALDEHTVQRLGETHRRQVNVRVIVATHRPLERMVNEGSFREDLLYRVAVAVLDLPPLRDRGQDVSILARHMLEHTGVTDVAVAEQLESELARRVGYPWPGNVRELRTFVRRVVYLGSGDDPFTDRLAQDAPPPVRADLPFKEARDQWNRVFEDRYVARLLDETANNVSEAARRAGLSRSYFYRILGRLPDRPVSDDEPG